jgi:outer membrane murein-binding lipoprotein Lpp
MKQFIQNSPTWAMILVASMVLNFMLAIKTWSSSNQAERLVRIETELQALNKKVDRLEDCVLARKAQIESAKGLGNSVVFLDTVDGFSQEVTMDYLNKQERGGK